MKVLSLFPYFSSISDCFKTTDFIVIWHVWGRTLTLKQKLSKPHLTAVKIDAAIIERHQI